MPYITHLISVALLVAEDGAEDNVVSAALLHDTLEDTETTREEIAEQFNERVAELVEHISEKKTRAIKVDWKESKAAYLTHLEGGPDDALLIAIADKIDNIESKLEAFEKEGSALLARWKRPPSDYLWYHGEAVRIAASRFPEHQLTKRLTEAHARECKALA